MQRQRTTISPHRRRTIAPLWRFRGPGSALRASATGNGLDRAWFADRSEGAIGEGEGDGSSEVGRRASSARSARGNGSNGERAAWERKRRRRTASGWRRGRRSHCLVRRPGALPNRQSPRTHHDRPARRSPSPFPLPACPFPGLHVAPCPLPLARSRPPNSRLPLPLPLPLPLRSRPQIDRRTTPIGSPGSSRSIPRPATRSATPRRRIRSANGVRCHPAGQRGGSLRLGRVEPVAPICGGPVEAATSATGASRTCDLIARRSGGTGPALGPGVRSGRAIRASWWRCRTGGSPCPIRIHRRRSRCRWDRRRRPRRWSGR